MVGRLSLNGKKNGKANGKKANGGGNGGPPPETALVPRDADIVTIGKYDPKFIRIAQEVCRLGATYRELAMVLDVNVDTITEWRLKYPAFEAATRVGKDEADERVTHSLFQRAVGYYIETVKLFVIDGEIKREPVREYVHADTTACIFWLKNRRPDQWREKQTLEHTGANEGPITIETARKIFLDRVFSVSGRVREVKTITKVEVGK
jgi:hypothetical protein